MRCQAKRPDHLHQLSTAEFTAIAIAAAGGAMVVVTAAASAIGAKPTATRMTNDTIYSAAPHFAAEFGTNVTGRSPAVLGAVAACGRSREIQ